MILDAGIGLDQAAASSIGQCPAALRIDDLRALLRSRDNWRRLRSTKWARARPSIWQW